MKLVNKLRLLAAGFVLLAVLVPAAASAQNKVYEGVCQGGGGGSPVCSGSSENPLAGPNGAIVRVTTILAIVAGVVSVIFLVWGGIKYITSNGDSSSIATAKSTIIAALIGLIIAALARPLINFVIGRI